MSLILHHLQKDISAQRWLIALWLLAVIALTLPDMLIFQPDYDAARAVDTFRSSPVGLLLGFITWTVLVARLIQSEPVNGSTSFWLTRPVPKRVYLLSKFIFLATLVMLPAFIPCVGHDLVFGSDVAEIKARVLNVLVSQLLALIAVIWLATYTPSLVYFAGMLCLAAVVSVIESTLISMYKHNYAARDSSYLVLVLIGLVVSLIVKHLRRGSRLGLYLGLTSIAFGMIYQFLAPPVSSTPIASTSAPRLPQVAFQPDWASTITWSHTSFANGQTTPAAFVKLTPVGENAGNRVRINFIAAQFDVPDGFSGGLTSAGAASYFPLGPEEAENTNLIEAKLPGIKLATEPYPVPASPVLSVCLFNLLGVEDKVRDKTGKLSLDILGEVLEMRQVAAIPLNDPHYIARTPGGFLRLRPISSTQPAHLLTIWSIGPTDFPSSGQGDYMCALVDPQTSTGKMLKNSGASTMSSAFRLGGTREVRDSVRDYVIDGTEPLERSVLYVFQYADAEEFHTQLVAPNFKMSPPAN